jgi:2'-5' RNA ligase
MRLFVAVDLNDEARRAIGAEQRRIVAALEPSGRLLRLVRPEQMHLTLAFVGEAAPATADAIVRAMSRPIDQPRFRLSFGGVGVFPEAGKPRALFVDVVEGLAELASLQRVVARLLQAAGVPPEPRPFRPHLTIARWRAGRPADRRRVEAAGSRPIASMEVGEAVLYRSQLSSSGPAYIRLAGAALR